MAYPVLAASNTWWKPNVSTVTRASITEIEIMDSYTPDSSVTVVDSWDASAAKDGSITCYVIGTKLIIAGNGSGKIAANEDSSMCFGGTASDARFPKMSSFLGASIFDTSNIVDAQFMFCFCSELNTIDVSTWSMSNVTNMKSMFTACAKLMYINGISNWDVSNVTNMNALFGNNSSITSLDLSSWNVSKVTNMASMFDGVESLTSLDLSSWNVSEVTTMKRMFRNCFKLTSIGDLSNWNVSNVTNMGAIFYNCIALTSVGDLSNWNTSKVTIMDTVFFYCEALTSVGDLSNWDTSNVTNMGSMFSSCSKLTGIGDLANWNTSNVTDMSFMFWGASSIKEIDVSNWDVSKVTNLDHFAAHAGLRRKGIENWKTTSLVNANAAFNNCVEEELDLSGWDVSKVQFFSQMFENSPNLKHIKGLEKWDTSSGVGFDEMFGRCYNLEELDLSSFNTSKAKNGVQASTNGHTTGTFRNFCNDCRNLKWIKLGPNFSINGDGTNTNAEYKLILPTPSADYIEGADGNWYTFIGDSYAPNAMKDKTAETYYASYDMVADMDVIVKNGSMIDAAKAIREKSGATTNYTPAQFGAAIRAL